MGRGEKKGGKKMNVIFYINFTGSIPCFIAHIPQRYDLKSIGGKIDTGLIMKDPHGNNTSLLNFRNSLYDI